MNQGQDLRVTVGLPFTEGQVKGEWLMYQVLELRKIENTDPQEFEIRLRDKENKKPGYLFTTYDGTELELRVHLKAAGMQGIDIDRLFKQAS
jgi:hypothetical protein